MSDEPYQPDTNPHTLGEAVTDNLRDRIAAVQAQHHHWDYAGDLTCACGESFGKETGWEAAVQEWAQHVADAVIAALPELRNTCGCVPIFPKADDD